MCVWVHASYINKKIAVLSEYHNISKIKIIKKERLRIRKNTYEMKSLGLINDDHPRVFRLG